MSSCEVMVRTRALVARPSRTIPRSSSWERHSFMAASLHAGPVRVHRTSVQEATGTVQKT